ncbi:MAG: hypothetical protein JWQ71_3777 [Pedosphaera sp.]|nr:hypothetical protein [Pedosphaera sp.]
MANRTPGKLLSDTVNEFEGSIQLTARASVWQNHLQYYHAARFKREHFTQIVGLAFMKSFLTWEAFLEEAFILYLLGKKSPNGYAPARHAIPMNRQHAVELLASDARHTDWTAATRVVSRANRFFKGGHPFVNVIRPQSNLLDNLKTIRNALSHESEEATDKFESLVRNELTFLPLRMVPGTFLMMLKPQHTPPKTYLQFYTETFRSMAEAIIPS